MGNSMTLTQADFDALQDERDLERAAYEARIAELEAKLVTAHAALDVFAVEGEGLRDELARVKAESLRVVEKGPVCAFKDNPACHCVFDNKLIDDSGFDVLTDDYICVAFDTIAQPVRLERWEDAE